MHQWSSPLLRHDLADRPLGVPRLLTLGAAASAMTCALLTMGTALKSKVSKFLPVGNLAPAG
jgi:hypothetical protein